jgi:DNA-binding response OmpR family regulator
VSTVQAVLYVEDDPLIREMAAEALQDAGFEVVTAKNGSAALDALDVDADPFRVIITDINLGDGPDGWAVARHARTLNDTLPVIYVTGGHGRGLETERVPHSVMIVKPFNPAQLVVAIHSLLNAPNAAKPSL